MQQSVGSLYKKYQEQLITHVMRKRRYSLDEATDLIQSFFLEVVLKRRLLSRYLGPRSDSIHDPLAAFLTKALDDFAVDQWRKQSKNVMSGAVAVDGYGGDEFASHHHDFDTALDRAWATEIFKEALQQTESHFRSKGNDRNWEAFEKRILIPARTSETPAIKQLANELGFSKPDDLSAAIQYVRKYFLRICRELILDQYPTKPEANERYQYFVSILLG